MNGTCLQLFPSVSWCLLSAEEEETGRGVDRFNSYGIINMFAMIPFERAGNRGDRVNENSTL